MRHNTSGKYDLWVVRSKVIAKEGGHNFPTSHPRYDMVDQGFHPLDVVDPFIPGDDPRLWHSFWHRQTGVVVASVLFIFFVGRWGWSWVDWVWHTGLWGHEDVGVGDEKWFGVRDHGRQGGGVDGDEVLIEKHHSLDDVLLGSMPINKDESLDWSW